MISVNTVAQPSASGIPLSHDEDEHLAALIWLWPSSVGFDIRAVTCGELVSPVLVFYSIRGRYSIAMNKVVNCKHASSGQAPIIPHIRDAVFL